MPMGYRSLSIAIRVAIVPGSSAFKYLASSF